MDDMSSPSMIPPVQTPILDGAAAPSPTRKNLLIGLIVVLVLGLGWYFLSGSGTGLKGSFVGDGTTDGVPLSGEAPAAITAEAKPADAAKSEVPAPAVGENGAKAPTPAPDAKPLPVAVKTITTSDGSVKAGASTTMTIKGSNLSPMIISPSGVSFTFSGTTIALTISSGAAATFSNLVINPDGTSATAKVMVGDSAVPGAYGVSYFDTAVSDKPLGVIANVLTVE